MTFDLVTAILLVLCAAIAALAWALWKLRQQMQSAFAQSSDRQQHIENKILEITASVQSNKEGQKTILSLLGDLGKVAKNAGKEEIEAVAAEVKMLQTVVDQLSKSRAVGGGLVTTISKSGKAQEAPLAPPPVIRRDYDADKILQVIEAGLQADRIDLYIQPIVSLPQRKIRNFECFSRIRDDEGAVILPEQYVQIAEQAGLMAAIDNMLLFRCIQLVRRANINNFHGSFFYNLSKHTLHDAHFFEDFLQFLKENKELASKLVFEVAQSDFDERDTIREKLLMRLSDAGCRLALAGVTNPRTIEMEAMTRCRFKYVKIEIGVLLQSLSAAPVLDLQIYRRVLENHNIDLIVERIEGEQQLLDLLEYDIDFGQGYLFGEPKLSRNQ